MRNLRSTRTMEDGWYGLTRVSIWRSGTEGGSARVGQLNKGCAYLAVVTESVAAILGIGPRLVKEWEQREGGPRGVQVSGGGGSLHRRYGRTGMQQVWQTFGWVGFWDIREVKVDDLRDAYAKRLQVLTQKVKEGESLAERRRKYGIWNGEIGGRAELDDKGLTLGHVEVEEGATEGIEQNAEEE